MQGKKERVRVRVSGRASCMCVCIFCKRGLGSGFERVGKFVGFLFLPPFGVGLGVHEMVLLRGVGWVEKATPILAHPHPNPQFPHFDPKFIFQHCLFEEKMDSFRNINMVHQKLCGFQRTGWEQNLNKSDSKVRP